MGQIEQAGRGYSQLPTPWTWMYYPPPYDFADPDATIPPPTFIAPAEEMGLGGGCGCGGTCGGCGHSHKQGMGQLFGDLFSSGFDISGWGWQEWGIVALGAYVLFSTVETSKSAVTSVRRGASRRASRSRRKAQLQQELDSF
jgi:hypothetical protein